MKDRPSAAAAGATSEFSRPLGYVSEEMKRAFLFPCVLIGSKLLT